VSANLLSVRRWDRPDRPQPVYTGAVNLFEAFRYVPVATAQRESVRTRARPGDRTYSYQTAPSFSWVRPVVDATVATWRPVFDAQRSDRTAERGRLDVRGFDSAPQPAWIFSAQPGTGPTVAQQWPAFQVLGVRTLERARLDVRRYDWAPPFGWDAKVVDGVVARWMPAITSETRIPRTQERPRLDVRRVTDSPELAWLFPVLPPPPVTTGAILTIAARTLTTLTCTASDLTALVVGGVVLTRLTIAADVVLTVLTVQATAATDLIVDAALLVTP